MVRSLRQSHKIQVLHQSSQEALVSQNQHMHVLFIQLTCHNQYPSMIPTIFYSLKKKYWLKLKKKRNIKLKSSKGSLTRSRLQFVWKHQLQWPLYPPGAEILNEIQMSRFWEVRWEELPICSLKVWGVAMALYRNNNKLLFQTFPRSLTRATLIWFRRLDISKIKKRTDLAHVFFEQDKFNLEIAPNREQL